ncbi:aldo/keto reductase [Roseomonas sp. CCTCC AB2023176]|uniref:aldo/keto reductase n=1 Tax=Roseomonas sp. CCTCC AB2023176 TaxID=3342640 RepID=UPI0035DFBC14
MEHRPLGRSGLSVAPLVLGGNVFGWTADRPTSFAILDAFVDAGLNGIDTADVYSRWVPGHSGGESETVIGEWLAANPGKRERVLILTKCGGDMGEGKTLRAAWIETAVEHSLRRLRTDRIDLYQAHWPDAATPIEETMTTFDRLVKSGKVRAVGASNYDATGLDAALRASEGAGVVRYETLQPEYNLMERGSFEGPLRDLCLREGVGVITYFSLAAGFLTGKYRSAADAGGRAREARVKGYFDERGMRVLDALDAVSARHGAKPAEVALAWLIAKPGVTAPIASATSVEQLSSLARAVSLRLSAEEMRDLDAASA